MGGRADLFTVRCNKGNVSLQGKGLSGLFSFYYKKFGSPELRVLHLWHNPTVCPASTWVSPIIRRM